MSRWVEIMVIVLIALGAAAVGAVVVLWYINPPNEQGKQTHADGYWSGWLRAVDAHADVWKQRLKSNYPIVGGVPPTAGGLNFFGDVGGNFYALNVQNGEKLWGPKIAIAGGVITYTVNDAQKVAVTTGFISPVWPTEVWPQRG